VNLSNVTPMTLTYSDAAKYLGIGRRSLERLVAEGTVRVVRPSPGRVLFRRVDLDAYLDRTGRGGEPKRGRSR
jgi:excisionase family DNA binding protein